MSGLDSFTYFMFSWNSFCAIEIVPKQRQKYLQIYDIKT